MTPHSSALRRLALAAAVVAACWALPAAAGEEAVPAFKNLDSIEARVQGCVTCHGRSGQGTQSDALPRIAAKPAGYLYNQLVAFRDGTRQYPPMNYLVAYLPDAYLREMAEYFAKQRPPFEATDAAPADAAMLVRGKAIATAGDTNKGIPACVACHGASLTGMEPGIPGLVGLRASYVAAQLTRWRVGSRHAAEPDCMKRIASARRPTSPPSQPGSRSRRRPRIRRPSRRTSCACRSRAAASAERDAHDHPHRIRATRPGRRGGGRSGNFPPGHAAADSGYDTGQRNDGVPCSRRVPRTRGRLRRLPYHAGRPRVRRWTRHADAIRESLRSQYHAG